MISRDRSDSGPGDHQLSPVVVIVFAPAMPFFFFFHYVSAAFINSQLSSGDSREGEEGEGEKARYHFSFSSGRDDYNVTRCCLHLRLLALSKVTFKSKVRNKDLQYGSVSRYSSASINETRRIISEARVARHLHHVAFRGLAMD